MIKKIRRTLNPGCYHGDPQNAPFFEGWYFKLVDADQKHSFAIIPGILISKDGSENHAFIQWVDGLQNKAYYIKYPYNDFKYVEGRFNIDIQANHFSSGKLIMNIDQPGFRVHGELSFKNIVEWPVSLLSPGIMGWYAWVPYMECFHGIVSLDHRIEGKLEVNNRVIDFTNGRGYAEKDWGQAFPQAWFWMQSNHFTRKNISFTGSTAIIPWIRRPFPGFIMGLWLDNHLYRFTTYNGSRISNMVYANKVLRLEIQNRNHILEVRCHQEQGVILKAPNLDGMKRDIAESLNSIILLRLYKRQKSENQLLFEDTGKQAGFEAAGDLDRLLTIWRNNRK